MLQYGDEALVSSLKRMVNAFYFVLSLLIFRAIFICGPGFAPFSIGGPAPNASVALPAFSAQLPLLIAAILAIFLNASQGRNLILVTWIATIVSSLLIVIWSALPVILVLIDCTFYQKCPAVAFFIGSLDMIILVVMSLLTLNALIHVTDYMRGYWQREAYLLQESTYLRITDPQNYANDPLRETEGSDESEEQSEGDNDTAPNEETQEESNKDNTLSKGLKTSTNVVSDSGSGLFPIGSMSNYTTGRLHSRKKD